MSIESEARRIIERIIHENTNSDIPLGEVLRDGVVLCKLLRILLREDLIVTYFLSPDPFQKLKNCEQALYAITTGFGIKCKFSAKDIIDGRKTNKIAKCVVLLVRLWGGNAQRVSLMLRKAEAQSIQINSNTNNREYKDRLNELIARNRQKHNDEELLNATPKEKKPMRGLDNLLHSTSLVQFPVRDAAWKKLYKDELNTALQKKFQTVHGPPQNHGEWRQTYGKGNKRDLLCGYYRVSGKWSPVHAPRLVRSVSDNVLGSNSQRSTRSIPCCGCALVGKYLVFFLMTDDKYFWAVAGSKGIKDDRWP
jgi:Calponin homology (CH) domain